MKSRKMKNGTVSHPPFPILLVDDEVHALRGYEMLLLAEGMANIFACESGQEALRYLSQFEVSCILLDLVMPEMVYLKRGVHTLLEFKNICVN